MSEQKEFLRNEEIELTYDVDRSVTLSYTGEFLPDLRALLGRKTPFDLEPKYTISESCHLFFGSQDLHSYVRMKLKKDKNNSKIRAVVENKAFLADRKTETVLYKTRNLTKSNFRYQIQAYGGIRGILHKRSCKVLSKGDSLKRGLSFLRIDQVQPVTRKFTLGDRKETHLELEFKVMAYMLELEKEIKKNPNLTKIIGQHKRKMAAINYPIDNTDKLWNIRVSKLRPKLSSYS